MIKRILAGYRASLWGLFRFIALLAAAVALGLAVVYPLWRLATGNPALYTAVFTALFSAILLALIAIQSIQSWKRDKSRFILGLSRKGCVILTLAGFVSLVLSRHMVAAFIALACGAALYGVLAFGLTRDQAR
jgi:hypothetical protein